VSLPFPFPLSSFYTQVPVPNYHHYPHHESRVLLYCPSKLSFHSSRSVKLTFRYMLLFPLLLILTPSPSKSTQSILYALSAPVRHGPIKSAPIQLSQPAQPLQPGDKDKKKKKEEEEVIDPRRSGVGGGDVVRDCAIVEYVFLPSFLLFNSSPLPLIHVSHRQGQDLSNTPIPIGM